jgi:tryptophan-rich sensory protein
MAEEPTTLRKLGETLGAIVLCNSIGGGTALAAGSGDTPWYRELKKPDWTPSGGTIAAVWTALYTLMGVSLSILWRARDDDDDAKPALQLFMIQLLLNSFWTFLFFRFKSPRLAFFENLVLIAAIALTIGAAWRVSKLAALLLVPYLLWSFVAITLNGAIWQMNASK